MTAILGTWNPAQWPWAQHGDARAATRQGRTFRIEWSVHRRRHGIAEGDRFYLLKQGLDPRGIVASGTIVGPPIDGPHWNGVAGATTRYVAVLLDAVVAIDDPLPLDLLRTKLPATYWTPQSGGTSVRANDEDALARLWHQHWRC